MEKRSMKLKILIVIVAVALLCAAAYITLSFFDSEWIKTVTFSDNSNRIFSPVDSSYDIMSDPEYLSLSLRPDDQILFETSDGRKTSYRKSEYGSNGPAMQLITDMLMAVQKGDGSKYESLFSENYKSVSEIKKLVSSHQIYDVVITEVRSFADEKTDKQAYIYDLQYKIRMNNGTFRDDITSDSSKTQRISMRYEGNELKIEGVETVITGKESYDIGKVIAVIAAFVLVAGAIIAVSVAVIRKINKKNYEVQE